MNESPKRGLLLAYRQALRPLFRILIRNGVQFDEFSEIARKTFADTAAADFGVSSKEFGTTRLSVLTGISASEIGEIQEEDKKISSDISTSFLNEIVAVLAGWHTDSEFTGPYGVPLELKFDEKGGASFTELVTRHASGIDPGQLLQELKAVDAVVELEGEWLKVLTRFYIPAGRAPDGLDHLARTLEDLVNTLEHNLLEPNPNRKMFERHVYTEDGIRPEDLPKFEEFAKAKATLLLEEIDNWLTTLKKPAENEQKRLSTGLGIFHYIHKQD